MRYVFDASVALKLILSEPDTAQAVRLWADAGAGVHELLAPDFFPVEVVHGVTRAERQGRLTPAIGSAFVTGLLTRLPVLHPSVPLLPRAYAISSTARIGVYDCLYVALAEREGCELVTADDRLVKTLGPAFPFITPLASFPP